MQGILLLTSNIEVKANFYATLFRYYKEKLEEDKQS